MSRDGAEVDVLEIRGYRLETFGRRRFSIRADDGASRLQSRGDDRKTRARHRGDLVAIDRALPDPSFHARDRLARLAGKEHPPLADDRELGTQVRDVIDDMGG